MSEGDEVDPSEGSIGRPPPLPSNEVTTIITSVTNPLGISPPGMKLRSGKKKQPTPMKGDNPLRSNKKRRRGDGDDDDSDTGTEGSENGDWSAAALRAPKRSRNRALEFELEPTIAEAEEETETEMEMEDIMKEVLDQDGDARMNDTEKETGANPDENGNANANADMDNAEDDSIVAAVNATLEKEAGPVDISMTECEAKDNESRQETNSAIASDENGNANANADMDNAEDDSIAVAVNATLEKEAGPVDTSMTECESKDNESHQETNSAIASINSVSSPPNIQLRTVDGLRLPSQHTPAPRKLDSAYGGKNKLKDFMTPAKGLAEEEAETGKDGNGSSINGNGTDSEVESLKLKMTNGAEVAKEDEERDEGRRDGLSHLLKKQGSSPRKTAILVTTLVCLHTILSFGTGGGFFSILPFWVWNNVSDMAGRKVTFYRDLGVFSTPSEPPMPEPSVIEEIVKEIVYEDNQKLAENEKELFRKRMVIEWWKEKKESATELIANMTELVERTEFPSNGREKMLWEHRNAFTAKQVKIVEWEEALKQAQKALQLKRDGHEPPENLDFILNTLVHASGNQISLNELHMISMSDVSIPGEECYGGFILQTQESEEQYTTEEDLANAKSEIEDFVSSTYADIRFDATLFKPISDWIDKELEDHAVWFNLKTPLDLENIKIPIPEKENEQIEIPSIDINDVKGMIHKKVEVIKADRLAKHDYASIRAGASIIYTGPRQTSPSLVENLPLGNQLMASLGLRFYGHGPEAALEPTFPADSLGQCWSFEKEGERKRVTIKEWAGEHEIENGAHRG